jgi:hypothetical protein
MSPTERPQYDALVIPLRRPARFLLLAVLVTVLVGCGASGPTTTAAVPSPTATAAELTPVPGGTTQPSGPVEPAPPTQTDTDWGRIWDALPPSFPVPPDAIPAEPFEGPASAAFAIGASGGDVADQLVSGLVPAGYSIEGRSQPLEDGSIVIDAIGADPACRVEVRVTPLSGTTRMVVMFGAECPFE